MENIRIIKDGKLLYHVYVGNIDFWLNKTELLLLYAAMLPIVKEGGAS